MHVCYSSYKALRAFRLLFAVHVLVQFSCRPYSTASLLLVVPVYDMHAVLYVCCVVCACAMEQL
jgi:hypothetical protein